MKKEIIDQFVMQYYEVKWPEPQKVGSDKIRKKLKDHVAKLKENSDWADDSETVDLIEDIERSLNPTVNQSLGYEVVKLKDNIMTCPDCQRDCKNYRKVNSQIYQHPEPHWRHSCSFCKQTRNPETGKFNLNNKAVASYYLEYFRNKK
jgi:hypothetical protein